LNWNFYEFRLAAIAESAINRGDVHLFTFVKIWPMSKPLITIIMPAYRAVLTLEKAVRSVVAQSERDWELIIIDDCSPDTTTELATKLMQEDARIRVIRQPENRGKPTAMNRGIAEAQGEWLGLLDADDWFAPDRLEVLLRAATQANAVMVADNQIFYDLKADAIAGQALPEGPDFTLGLDAFLQSSDPTASFDYGMLKPIIRTEFIRKHALSYYEPARIGEDHLFLLGCFAVGAEAAIVNRPLYYYLQPFGTVSRQWAQADRAPYDFDLLFRVNQHGLQQWSDKLTPAQRQILVKRGEGIVALARFHRLRTALKHRKLGMAVREVLTAPLAFWQLIGGRLSARFFAKKPNK
jgi:succinoglycan biosynthesis protein ExoO